MKKATTALFVVLMFVFSCTKESVSPDLDSGYDVLKKADVAKKVTKTLKFHESSGIVLNPPVPCEVCDMCESPSMILVQGTGHATHLGAFTVINYFCLSEYPPTVSRRPSTGESCSTIHTMVTKEPYVDDRGLVYYYSILDGTGRFKGASGHILMWGLIDYDLGIFDLEGLGEITY